MLTAADADPARLTLRTFALAAIAPETPPNQLAPETRYLAERRTAAEPDGRPWRLGLEAYIGRPAPVDRPLLDLANRLGLSLVEVLAVALAAGVELDVLVGRAVAHVQAPIGGSRPTLGLLAAACSPLDANAFDGLATGAALASGLLTFASSTAPLVERPLAVAAAVCHALTGHDGAWPGASIGQGELPRVPLPPSTLRELGRFTDGLRGKRQALLVRCWSNAEARSVAVQLGQQLGRRAVFVDPQNTTGITPWLLLRDLLPVFSLELAPGERSVLPSLPFYDGPLLVLLGPDGNIEVPSAGGAMLTWTLSVPPRDERQLLWSQSIYDDELAAELARDHRHSSGRIAQLAELAMQCARLDGRVQPTLADVTAASRSAAASGLDGLAQPLPDTIADEALVMPEALRADLAALLLRCRARDGLVEGLGLSAVARYTPGVRALFVGPSGTGKTLAAGWLATQLGQPLLRVDLSAITSKYIGETEKHLAQLLAHAEHTEVVLLFDEADSLFGKRTDVKESNDRFANAQTNYLLQRIESFDGITLLTSNSRLRFDSAFARRLDAVIEFPIPGPTERRALWQAHLGNGHTLGPAELNRLAAGADLVGGHIRNVVLFAAVLAHAANRPINYADVLRGLGAEYRKLGGQLPHELTN